MSQTPVKETTIGSATSDCEQQVVQNNAKVAAVSNIGKRVVIRRADANKSKALALSQTDAKKSISPQAVVKSKSALGRNELLEYLSYVLNAEKDVYALKKTLDRMDGQIRRLGRSREISAPAQRSALDGVDATETFGLIFGLGVVFAIIWAIGAWINEGGLFGIFAVLLSSEGWGSIISGFFTGLAIGGVIFLLYFLYHSSESREYNETNARKYEDEVEQDQIRVN